MSGWGGIGKLSLASEAVLWGYVQFHDIETFAFTWCFEIPRDLMKNYLCIE